MSRISFYIDGLNVYYALNKERYRKYKWLDYYKLAEATVRPKDVLVDVLYFTTYARWKHDSFARHKLYMKALRSREVIDIQGRFMKVYKKCHVCGEWYKTHEEKQTDVNVALRLLADAVNERFDRAVIVSADTDLLPIIETVHSNVPDKDIGIMLPVHRSNRALTKAADFTVSMKESILQQCQFPDEFNIGKITLKRPASWS